MHYFVICIIIVFELTMQYHCFDFFLNLSLLILFLCFAGQKRPREDDDPRFAPDWPPGSSTSSKRHVPKPTQKARPSSSSSYRRPKSPQVVVSSDDESSRPSFPRVRPKEQSVVTWLTYYAYQLYHFFKAVVSIEYFPMLIYCSMLICLF